MILTREIEKYLKVTKGAIHVGANIGEERIWYKEHGFKKVLWFEPNPDVFSTLEENIEGIEGQQAFNLGIHDSLRDADLFIASNGGQSSSILDFGSHKINHPDVYFIGRRKIKMVRMDDFLKKTGRQIHDYNFLNADVQGVELNVIRSFGDLLYFLDYIYLEVNIEEVYKGCALVSDIDKYLKKFGFHRRETKITKAGWGDAFYIK